MLFNNDNMANVSKSTSSVFVFNMDLLEEHIAVFLSYLSSEEIENAGKFLYRTLRTRYIISHGILRVLLGRYISLHPRKIEYYYNNHCKPFCLQSSNLFFNMSHSRNFACYGFSLNAEVGVDIEYKNDQFELSDLLINVLSSREMQIIKTQPKDINTYLFYKTWTIKEAFLKALGVGLSHPLTMVETSLLPKNKFEVTKYLGECSKDIRKHWTFSSIKFSPEYLGAVAIKKKAEKINFYCFI